MTSTKKIESAPAEVKELYEAALQVRQNSYSPYSRCRIGAAVRTEDGRIVAGTNIENVSFGATVCAERVAIWSALAQGPTKITEVMVISDSNPPWPPCGMCRQVISEFVSSPQAKIHRANPEGDWMSTEFSEVFPESMTPDHIFEYANRD